MECEVVRKNVFRKFNKKTEQLCKLHNKYLDVYNKDGFRNLDRAKEIGLKLLLFVNNYCCEKCETPTNLTIHHLIGRNTREWMCLDKYIRQRHYFDNQLLLCVDCHAIVHNFGKGWKIGTINGQCVISQEKIDKIRKELEE